MIYQTTNLTPADIEERLAAHCCLRCGLRGMKIDPDTGFYQHYCTTCVAWNEQEDQARKRAAGSPVKFRNDHKNAGLGNLDRLTK